MRLAHDVHGDDRDPVVVCLPMFATTRGFTAAALGPAFLGAPVRLVHVDLPGHGDSPPTSEATSEAVLAAVRSFVVSLAEVRGRRDVLLAGCSYGAYLAAAMARRWPDSVRGLFLVSPGVLVAAGRRDLPSAPEDGGAAGWLDDTAPAYRSHLDLALGHRTRSVAANVSAMLVKGTGGDEEYQDRLHGDGFTLADEDADHSFGGPVTIVAGRQDRIVGYADQYRALRRYPRGTYAVVDGAGHYLPFEQPRAVRHFALDWLNRCGVGVPLAS